MKNKKTEKSEQKSSASKLNLAQAQIDKLQQEKDELFQKLQRISADYANYQKRAPKQIADTVAYEKEKIIKTILPALDNFEHTLQNANSTENIEVILKAIEIIYEQFLAILKSHNVETIKALGENFDPSLHQAILQKTDTNKKDGVVLEEFQKGYKLSNRVIRPTKVIVNTLKQPKEKTENPENMSIDNDQNVTEE